LTLPVVCIVDGIASFIVASTLSCERGKRALPPDLFLDKDYSSLYVS
jgi:hypothetical protein